MRQRIVFQDEENPILPADEKVEYILEGVRSHRYLETPEMMDRYADACLNHIMEQDDIKDAEVFVANSDVRISELSYTTGLYSKHISPKSTKSEGVGIRLVFKDGRVAYEGARRIETKHALDYLIEAGRKGTVHDPDFVRLPVPVIGEISADDDGRVYNDDEIANMDDTGYIKIGNDIINGALDVYMQAIDDGTLDMGDDIQEMDMGNGKVKVNKRRTNITIHGHVRTVKENTVVKSSTGIDAHDSHTMISGSVMTGWEKASPEKEYGFVDESKARGRDSSAYLKDFNAKEIGASAARNALQLSDGKRIKTGNYKVILSPQAVAELMTYVGGPSLNLVMQDFYDTIFPLEDAGTQVISEKLSIFDDPTIPEAMSSRKYTSEGIQTKKTDLIKDGMLKDFIKDTYFSNKFRDRLESKGIDTTPRNGFRFEGGYSDSAWTPRPQFTNLCIVGNDTVPIEDMYSSIKEGEKIIFIDQLWYTYPMNQGDRESERKRGSITSSSPAGSYMLERKDDELVRTLIKPNTFRLSANVLDVLNNVEQVSTEHEAIYGWASDHTIDAPFIQVSEGTVHLEEIAKFLEGT